MLTRYVIEHIKNGVVSHIGVENIREAQQVLKEIPKEHRGSVYPLYSKDILVNKKEEEDIL